MSHVVRTSIIIDGSRLQDAQFTSVYLQQSIGWHHSFEIRLRQDAIKGALAEKAKEWIGKNVQLGFDIKPDNDLAFSPIPDVFKGIITSVGLARSRGTAELVIKGQSPTLAADDGPHSRSFTEKSLQEIVDEVLKDYKGAFPEAPSVEPKVFTASIPYTVQYKESNFAFVVRLANRYGEWCYYDGLKFFFGKPEDEDVIPLNFSEKSLIDFDLSVRALPAKFELRGYDYVKHEELQQEAAQAASSSSLGEDVLGISTNDLFPQTTSTAVSMAMDKEGLKNLAERMEQVRMDEMMVLSGSSRNPKLRVGARVEVMDKELGENYGVYVITNLSHDIMQGGAYTNHFEAIPEEVATPPLSTIPDPPFCEAQLAKVTAVDDEKSLGRVKVKFLWQEGSSETSPWIRVASPYTGKDKGFYIIPEIEDQVLVAFENNHPDKPYVLTGMYNGDAKPEWFDGKNKVKGFKSEGKNEWKFDDKEESISLNAPQSINLLAGKEISIKTKGEAGSSITLDTGDGTVTIKAKTIKLEATNTLDMNSDSNATLNGKSSMTVKSASGTVSVEASATNTVKGQTVNVGDGSGPVNVKGATVKLN